jgi:hypothetical protein
MEFVGVFDVETCGLPAGRHPTSGTCFYEITRPRGCFQVRL